MHADLPGGKILFVWLPYKFCKKHSLLGNGIRNKAIGLITAVSRLRGYNLGEITTISEIKTWWWWWW